MSFRPLHDRVLVRRLDSEPMEGEVLSVGPGARTDKGELLAPSVKVGDRVLFAKYAGTDVKMDGEERVIVKESDILGIIDGAVSHKKAA